MSAEVPTHLHQIYTKRTVQLIYQL